MQFILSITGHCADSFRNAMDSSVSSRTTATSVVKKSFNKQAVSLPVVEPHNKKPLDAKALQIAVSKALRDNLKGWTDVEVRGSRDQNGQSLIKRLEDRTELNHQDPKKYPIGGNLVQGVEVGIPERVVPPSDVACGRRQCRDQRGFAAGEQPKVEAKRKEAIKKATATLSAVANPKQMSGGKSSAAASNSSSSSSSLVNTAASSIARGKHTISEREDVAVTGMFKMLKSM